MKLLFPVLIFLIPFLSFGQCPESNANYYFQEHIDEFKEIFPDCIILQNQLRISGDDITNIDGFSNIIGSESNIIIDNNNNLRNIEGLENLQYVNGNLSITRNDTLMSLTGLENLETVGGSLSIGNNAILSEIDIFDNLKSVGTLSLSKMYTDNLLEFNKLDEIKQSLSCVELSGLRNLEGLEKIDNLQIEELILLGNLELEGIQGIDNLTIAEIFGVAGNISLSIIDNVNLEDSISEISLFNNANLENCCFLDLIKNENCCDIGIDDCYSCINYPDAKVTVDFNGSGCSSLNGVYSVCSGEGNYCDIGTKYEFLNSNNVSALLSNDGNTFNSRYNFREWGYEVPKGSGLKSIYSAALWMGGIDEDDKLRIASPTYRVWGNDIYAGPILEEDIESCSDFNKLWKTEKGDVYYFINAFIEKNGEIEIEDIPNSILNYPGKNNPLFNEFDLPKNKELAPFVDSNEDGNYNPFDGDFPLVKGDQSIWWVYNDSKLEDKENDCEKEPLNMEVSVTAYSKSSTDYINNTTFYDYRLEYFGDKPLRDFYIGLWFDNELGTYDNDFVGCNVEQNMGFSYNGTRTDYGTYGYDNNIPTLGVKILESVKDKGNNEVGMSSFRSYIYEDTNFGNPKTAEECYDYLSGKWKDGTFLTFGGNGYGGTEPYPYMYPDPPNDPDGWSELTAESDPGDRVFLMTFGPIDLMPGDVQTFTKAILWEPNVGGGEEVELTKLFENGKQLELDYDEIFKQDCKGLVAYYQDLDGDGFGEPETKVVSCEPLDGYITVVDNVAISELDIQKGLSIFPNPASDKILCLINALNNESAQVEIYNVTGSKVYAKSQNLNIGENKIMIDIEYFAAGSYFVKIIDENENNLIGKFVKN